MQTPNYTRTAVVLHWLIGIAVLAQITLGLWMITIPKTPPGVRAGWFNVHKSIGITLAVADRRAFAVAAGCTAPAAAAGDDAGLRKRCAAKASHFLRVRACMIVMPVSGYLGSSFTKYPVLYWGVKLPQWGWDAPELKDLCSQVHFVTVCIFIALIAIHIAAAVKHWLVERRWTICVPNHRRMVVFPE